MSSQNLVKVFVYGTLKSHQPNHFLLQKAENGFSKFISSAITTEKFPLVVATRYNIPFLLNKPGVGENHIHKIKWNLFYKKNLSNVLGNFINGEIFEVDDKMFKVLDQLEEYPTWYDREIQEMDANGEKISCWVYMLKNFPENLLKLPFLTSYESTKDKQYLERSKRTSISAHDDLEFGIDGWFNIYSFVIAVTMTFAHVRYSWMK